MSPFQQKKYEPYRETGEYDSYTGIDAGNRNCPWEWPDIGFNRQRLQSSYYKYVQRTKGKHILKN